MNYRHIAPTIEGHNYVSADGRLLVEPSKARVVGAPAPHRYVVRVRLDVPGSGWSKPKYVAENLAVADEIVGMHMAGAYRNATVASHGPVFDAITELLMPVGSF